MAAGKIERLYMDSDIEQAMWALYRGDRTRVEKLLGPKPRTPQALWLLASSVEDEDMRQDLLKKVVQTQAMPYALLAADILEREHTFEEEMARAPGWQLWLLKHRPTLMRIGITIVVLSMLALVVLWIFTPPAEDAESIRQREVAVATQAALQATADTLALTPTVTPTATLLPSAAQNSVTYQPLGALRVVSYGYPSTLPVGANRQIEEPSSQFDFAAIQFEFTCGTGFDNNAFCNNPPEVRNIALAFTDGSREDYKGHTVVGTTFSNAVPVGQTMRAWIAFRVPVGSQPTALILTVPVDAEGREVQEVSVPLPS